MLFSDSHGDKKAVAYILDNYQKTCDMAVFCGDGCQDVIDKIKIPLVMVKGNNDSAFLNVKNDKGAKLQKLDDVVFFNAFGKKIMVTHGHLYGLYTNVNALLKTAKLNTCDIVIFGHLHVLCDKTYFNTRLISPGSCSLPRDTTVATFAILEKKENKILFCPQYI